MSWARFSRGGDGRLTLDAWGIESLSEQVEEDSAWLREVAAALAKLRKSAGGGAVHLGIPGHLVLTKFVRTPAIAGSKRAKVVEFEAAQNIPYALDEVVWDHLVMGERGSNLDLMLAAAKADRIEGLCATAEAAGLVVVRAMPAGVALWRGFRWNYPEATGGGLIVHVGSRSTQLVFVERERFFVRTLSHVSADKNLPARLQAEISRTLAHARRQGMDLDPRAVWMSGVVTNETFRAALAGTLKLPVNAIEPVRRVDVTGAFGSRNTGVPGRLAGAVGLAVAAFGGDAGLDLRPRSYRRAVTAKRRRVWWAMAAVLLVPALGLPIWQFRRATAELQSRAAEIEARIAPMRTMERRVAAGRETLEQMRVRESQLRRVVDARTAWLRLLAELQEALEDVDDVWLDRLTIEETERPGGGELHAAEPLRIAISGRMLDRARPTERANASNYERVRRLLERFEAGRSVAAVEHPRFDNSQPGILSFDVSLVMEASWRVATSGEEAVR